MVQVSGWALHLVERSLAESMDVRTMVHLARRLIHNYDIYERSGYPKIIAIPNRDAARQIVNDMKKMGLFLDFVKLLIDVRKTGLMGRKYRIPYIKDIIREIENSGFIYSFEDNNFIENPAVRKTINWGILKEGEEYIFSFLRFDMVGSSKLTRTLSRESVEKIYKDVRNIVSSICEKRNGRVWLWEGDGGLAAFYFYGKENHSAISAIEILHEIAIYNLVAVPEKSSIKVRLAVHNGPWAFTFDREKIKGDTIERVNELEEKYTKPNTVTFSSTIYRMLNQGIADILEQFKVEKLGNLYRYKPGWSEL